MRRRICWFVTCLLLWSAGVFAETIYIYGEEIRDGQDTELSYVMEGLWEGLFEAGHIVFDDRQQLPLDWAGKDFNPLVKTALNGGARYCVAVRINTESASIDRTKMKLKSRIEYAIIDTRRVQILCMGEFVRDNNADTDKLDVQSFGMMVGGELAGIVEKQINTLSPEGF